MPRSIEKVLWFTQSKAPHFFGIVVTKNDIGEKKAYIGVAPGADEEKDIKQIADHGARIQADDLKEIIKILEQPATEEKS